VNTDQFSLLMAMAVFSLSILDDVGAVFYFRRIVSGKRYMAALLSGALTAMISLEVVIYATNPVYIPFNCVGSVLGTWLAMALDERLPKQISRDSKGKFKKPPPRELLSEKGRVT